MEDIFHPFEKVQGNASALGTGSYNFSDPNAINTATYYRIKMYEGTEYKYSKIIYIAEPKQTVLRCEKPG